MTSSDGVIVVVARWQTAAGHLDDVLSLVDVLRRRSLEEPGCLGYDVLVSDDEPDTVVLVERYRDRAAVDAHRATDHYRELLTSQILPLLTARRVELLRALG